MSVDASLCVRCGQPVVPGQFKVRVDYIPVDVADLLRQPQCPPEEQGFLSTWSAYWMHVDCPPVPEEQP